jgi:hypothetical protein
MDALNTDKLRQMGTAEQALAILRDLDKAMCLGDLCYLVRDREGQGWDGPRVKLWGDACERMRKLFKANPEPKPEPKPEPGDPRFDWEKA